MYKLLTTAAVIMTVATPTLAWDGAANLIKGLNDVYTGVDGAGAGGTGHFEGLQTGALGAFVDEANKGVTHVVLNVDPVDHTISASISGGTTLSSIQGKQTDLINQVNYDLFVDTDTGSVETYTGTPSNPGSTPITEVNNDGTVNWANANSGLVGVKVGKIVKEANDINNYLTSGDNVTSHDDFKAAFDLKTGTFGDDTNGADIGNLFFHIEGADGNGGINSSIEAANNAGNDFFGNIDDQQGSNAIDGSNVGNYSIAGYDFGTKLIGGGVIDGGYDTLLDWANAQ